MMMMACVYMCSGGRWSLSDNVDTRSSLRITRRSVSRARLRVLRGDLQHVQEPGRLEEAPTSGDDRDQHHGQHSVAVPCQRTIRRVVRQKPTALPHDASRYRWSHTLSQKSSPFYFCDYTVKFWLILIMFGSIVAEEICNKITYSFIISFLSFFFFFILLWYSFVLF